MRVLEVGVWLELRIGVWMLVLLLHVLVLVGRWELELRGLLLLVEWILAEWWGLLELGRLVVVMLLLLWVGLVWWSGWVGAVRHCLGSGAVGGLM